MSSGKHQSVSVEVELALFERLQGYAVPLVDDVNSILRKLCDCWEIHQGGDSALPFGDLAETNDDLWVASLPIPVKERIERIFSKVVEQINASNRSINETLNKSALQAKERTLGLRSGSHFITSSGVSLPAPMRIYADYQGKRILGEVSTDGIKVLGIEEPFSTPSQAAIAAKGLMGTEGKAANTNGWTFWMVDAPSSDGRAKSLDFFRQGIHGLRSGQEVD